MSIKTNYACFNEEFSLIPLYFNGGNNFAAQQYTILNFFSSLLFYILTSIRLVLLQYFIFD